MATKERTEEKDDLGLGTGAAKKGQRMLNKNGSYNVKRTGLPWYHNSGLYHLLITMSWLRFFLLLALVYILANLLFAGGYFFIGVENLDGMRGYKGLPAFLEAFFLSTQTFTTVGYGRLNPIGMGANFLSAFESMTGLLFFALATGLLFARFSRPVARVLFSRNAVIAPYRGGRALMFRLVNQRSNQLIEVEVNVSFSMNITVDGAATRYFDTLTLERKGINFFPLSWTVVHPINEESPIHRFSIEEMVAQEAEFIILLKAYDDNFSQTVYTRTSYKADEIVQGAKFSRMFQASEDGAMVLDLSKLHDIEPAELPKT